jgi:hypothetical protein
VQVDHDLDQPGQGEQQRVVELLEKTPAQVSGCCVTQRQPHRGVEARLRSVVIGPREPQHGDVARAAVQLVDERRYAEHGRSGTGERPAHGTGGRRHPRLVGHRQHGREPDTETPHGRVVPVVALGRRTQGRQ